MIKRLSFLIAFAIVAAVPVAQAQNCRDPWITAALKRVGRGSGDSGDNGLCNAHRYADAHWSSQNELNTLVEKSFNCPEPWLGEIYFQMGYGIPTGDQCNIAHYNGGHWNGYDDLKRAVSAYVNAPKPKPVQMVSFGMTDIVNNDGGVCIDAEGGARDGARLIAYACNGQPNQMVTIDNRLRFGSLCAQADSRNEGSEIHLHSCSGNDSLQGFAWWRNNESGSCTAQNPCIGHNSGRVLAAAGSYFPGNRPLCLWSYHGISNQHWKTGHHASLQAGSVVLFPSWVTQVRVDGKPGVSTVSNGLITVDGAGVIAQGGGNVIAQGGGNVIAQGGGNVIASGAGN